MTRLYELQGYYKELADRIDDGAVVEPLELAAVGDALEQKGAGIVHVLAQLDADEAALKAEMDRLTARRRTLQANRERLREYVKRAMLDHNVTKLRAGTFSISVSEGPEQVVVEDEALLPETYVRVKREPNKAAVLDAYRQTGEIVAGCSIQRGWALRIR